MNSLFTGFSSRLARYRIAALMIILAVSPASAQELAKLDKHAPEPAPELHYVDDQGANKTLNAKDHKLTIVHFWATWCAPCVGELPEVNDIAKNYGKALQVITISLDGGTNMDQVKQFIMSHNLVMLVPYLDPEPSSFRAIKGQGLPTTIFIDKNNQEIARAEGGLDWKSSEVNDFIKANLK